MNRILIIEDDRDIADLVRRYLEKAGFSVEVTVTGRDGMTALTERPPDLLVLDLMLPHMSGAEICHAARANPATALIPIIMLTARSEEAERIAGLEIGADDYIAKPFDLRELLARVRTVLRRRADADARRASPEPPPDTLRLGRWLLDLDAHKLINEDGGELRLTAMEFDLLHAFARHPNKVLSRNQLLDLAHNKDWEPFDRGIDIRVARLRKKIERDPTKPQIIKTIPGVGYMYVSEGR